MAVYKLLLLSSQFFITIHHYYITFNLIVLVHYYFFYPINSFIITSSWTGYRLNRFSAFNTIDTCSRKSFSNKNNNNNFDRIWDRRLQVVGLVHRYHHNHRQQQQQQQYRSKTQLYLAPKSAKSSTSKKTTTSKSKSTPTSSIPLLSEFLSDFKDTSSIDIIEGPFHSLQLRNYWGTKPLLIRKAFDPTTKEIQDIWPSWDDIVALSCWDYSEDDSTNNNDKSKNNNKLVESGESARFIRHTLNQLDSFDLEIGPFERQYLQNIIKKSKTSNNNNNHQQFKWTIILNDVNRYIDTVQQWMDRTFNFIPKWRRDDIQISLAPDGGGIGPHVDNYDVCLIQMSGQRLWEIFPSNYLTVEEEYNILVPDIPVRILNISSSSTTTTFQKSKDIDFVRLVLNPGDMLYLPPRIIHCGTGIGGTEEDGSTTGSNASTSCMTLSVGFRSPSASDVVSFLAESIQQSTHESAVQRYTDNVLTQTTTPTDNDNNNPNQLYSPSITSSIRSDFKDLLLNAINTVVQNETEWDKLIGEILTQSIRYSENVVIPYEVLSENDDSVRDTFGRTAHDVVTRIVNSNNNRKDLYLIGCSGISFATSRIMVDETNTNNNTYIDRIYAYGNMYGEVTNDPYASRIFHKIETGQKLYSNDLLLLHSSDDIENQSSLLRVITYLVQEGILKPKIEWIS